MSLKRFNSDVRAARQRLHETGIKGISVIERGDSDGEVVVTFIHGKLPKPLPIRVLAQNVDEYPDGNNFLLFIDSDDSTDTISSTLEGLQNFTFGHKILEAITTLSTGIQHALSNIDSDGDTTMRRAQGPQLHDDRPEDEDGEEPYDYFDDGDDDNDDYEEFGLSPLRPSVSRSVSGTTPDILRRIRSDLRKARGAGCRVSIIGGLDDSKLHLLSLSVRASKLGLSQEALEAWDVEASDYIVLLSRTEDLYPCAEKVAQNSAANFHIQFRFGKCSKYKPTLRQALAAFASTSQKSTGGDTNPPTEIDDQLFQKTFISASLEQFMNESFISLVKLRFRGCATWDDANTKLRNLSSMIHDDQAECKEKEPTNPISADMSEGKAMEAPSSSTGGPSGGSQNAPKALPSILLFDPFAEPEPSIPLIAMHFALHYFVRCTEYCLRCHRQIDKEFEALKPFVCSDPLCLFQYITMGLGPSIEHEMITQPYVVDLLISLCYSSLQIPSDMFSLPARRGYPIRDFPSGLRLKIPSIVAGIATDEDPIKVTVNLRLLEASFSCVADIDSITVGTWVVLRHSINHPTGRMGQAFNHHAYIKYIDRQTSSFTIELMRQDPSDPIVRGIIDMDLFPCSVEFDDLDESGKAKAMIGILDTIPPVSHIREYLIKNPQSKLRSFHSISPAAATLLEWIVASNRSCILQISPVDDYHAQDKELLATIKTRNQEAIPSMNSCVQFRFAQGAPDKELRFHRALRDLHSQRKTKYPTLFAWHGSALGNWNSILRQGLDFKEVRHGRALGHGVYFSQDFNTSSGYVSGGATWPYSALNASGVISLCEIVNAPKKFVATNPHLVVKQLDWIQCRYLFVQQQGRSTSSASSADAGTAIETISQDPDHSVRGPKNAVLEIPIKAIPGGRAEGQAKKQSSETSSPKRAYETVHSSGDSDEEDGADILFLMSSDDESSGRPSKRVSSDPARDSSVDTARAREVTVRRPPTPPQTDFRPGSLDLSTLPRLPVPEWANSNSTKRLASDIKHMQKVQASTPLHELGWYIDFDKVDNMFQWIVELHSFDPSLPLAQDMKKAGVTSVVLEVRFGREYPFSPPFLRVIRPRFLPFASGGGGHVTIGGAVCLELLTSTGWSPVTSMEAVFLSVRMAMSETEPAARLQTTSASARVFDYAANEALDAYVRFAFSHGWKVPGDLRETAGQVADV